MAPGDAPAADQPQDGLARRVGDVGTDALDAEGGGALIALGSAKICELFVNAILRRYDYVCGGLQNCPERSNPKCKKT